MGDSPSVSSSMVMSFMPPEKLGFNVSYTTVAGQAEAYYSIGGCLDPDNITDRGCGPNGPSVTGLFVQSQGQNTQTLTSTLNFSNFQKVLFVPFLTSSGYEGLESMYFSSRELDAAYEAEGLALDHYTGCLARLHPTTELRKYFDNPEVVNKSYLKPCLESNFGNDGLMSTYLSHTGDTDGVLTLPNGKKVGVCPDDYWWPAPACRSNLTNCIIWITGGSGYGFSTTTQKVTKWNMPFALGVGKLWGDYIQTARDFRSMFYWWVPDPTFLSMAPVSTTFPDYDKLAWAAGDVSTDANGVRIDKVVSSDLNQLSPRIQNFLENLQIEMGELNKVLLDQPLPRGGEDWEPMICRWLQNNNQTWQLGCWIPDDSDCFPKFGLYNVNTEQFVLNRDDKEGLSCRACPSGTYSKQLIDNSGPTYICEACPAGQEAGAVLSIHEVTDGTSQASGAALACDPCVKGEYQDELGQQFCKRCDLGDYQDEEGGAVCKECPLNSRTLQKGSFSFTDCGCEAGYIDVAQNAGSRCLMKSAAGELSCIECQTGLSCPVMGTYNSLINGSHPLGKEYLPTVSEGFYSTAAAPLEASSVYRCGLETQCPGGLPQSCSGGLIGVPCAECQPGFNLQDGACEKCEDSFIVLWAFGIVFVFLFLTAAYYLMTSKVTAKASVLFTTTCAFGMLISLLQSIGIIGAMTVKFPVNISAFFGFFSILLLDLDNFGFVCLAGNNTPLRYLVAVLFFPAGIACYSVQYGTKVSQLVPKSYRWDFTKVLACMGQFLQVGFSTMAATALAPLTCYTHPNKLQSLLKYPNVICGTGEHGAMLGIGITLLVIGVFGFLAVCSYGAYMVPSWSAREKHGRVRAFRFLVFRFRLGSSWWFGVPLLTRGPLIALPIVLATDYPAVQTVWVTFILLCFLACQALAWPWKAGYCTSHKSSFVPLLNALDCWMSYCIMILVAASALYLEPINKEGRVVADFVNNFNTTILVVIFSSISAMILMALTALFHRAAMGGNSEYAVFNLGRTNGDLYFG
eukprot:Skav229156  [mRNA]  locus=scaffold622:70590:100723:- [translate_table: standard]